jgi:hypothetical protein
MTANFPTLRQLVDSPAVQVQMLRYYGSRNVLFTGSVFLLDYFVLVQDVFPLKQKNRIRNWRGEENNSSGDLRVSDSVCV